MEEVNEKIGMEEEEETRVEAAAKPREPTPDHPPYSWMIGEAITSLSEEGGSTEALISSFIRARYPSVPPAHDRLLQHYLAKHIAEGMFVCTCPGRYSRRPDDPTVVDAPVNLAMVCSDPADVETPVIEVKRGRGRPRKDGTSTSLTPVADKDSGEAPAATPKRHDRPQEDGSSPTPITDKKDGGQALTAAPKRRGRPRKDSTSLTPVADKKGGGEALAASPKRRGRPRKDGFSPTPVTDKNDGSSLTLVTDKKDGPSLPKRRGRPRKDSSSLTPVTGKKDGSSQTPVTDKKDSSSLTLTPVTGKKDGSSPTPVTDKNDGAQVLAATPKRRGRPRKDSPSATPVTSTKDGGEAPSATPKLHGLPRKLYPVVAYDIPDDPSCCVLGLRA